MFLVDVGPREVFVLDAWRQTSWSLLYNNIELIRLWSSSHPE